MNIEYLDAFEELQAKDTFRGQQWFGKRQHLVEKYSWAVPNERVIAYLAEFAHLYEAGAGSGYWANCITEAGGNVTPFDKDPVSRWTEVEEATVEEMQDAMRDEPVLLVWPPYDDPMAEHVLDANPSHVCYVGEQRGGCTGTDEFHEQLQREYGLVGRIEIPSYASVHDDFYHYIRKV